MKTRLTYFHFLLLPCIVLLLFSSGILFISFNSYFKDQRFNSNEKTLVILSMIIFTGTFLYFIIILIPKYKKYRKLCNSLNEFISPTQYQEFIDHAGSLFPGLDCSIHRINSLLEQQGMLKYSAKQAEFLALQNQINPHFLYNTLDAIRSDALVAGMTEIANITEALSKFFRYTITNLEQMVILRDEIENVKKYFIIQKYRFGENLNLELNIADDPERFMRVKCPKLFLQPLVENAIFHGLEPMEKGGTVTISIDSSGSDMLVRVSDNGIGIPENTLINLNKALNSTSPANSVSNISSKKSGIALQNVCRRIKLLFGEKYGLHISSIPGVGTVAEIRLPLHTDS